MVRPGQKLKKHKRLGKGVGNCYMSKHRTLSDTSCSSEDYYLDGNNDTPLINFNTLSEYLADYLSLSPCPFVLKKKPANKTVVFGTPPVEIECSVGTYLEPSFEKYCKKCNQAANKCAFSLDFQTGYSLHVTADQPLHQNGWYGKMPLDPIHVHDVRFRNHAASLVITRHSYYRKDGRKVDRKQVDLILGVRAMFGGTYSIRLIKALLTHCADGFPRKFTAEGYGISDTTVRDYEKKLCDSIADQIANNLDAQLSSHELLTARDSSGKPYLHSDTFYLCGEKYHVVYKFTPLRSDPVDTTEQLWKEKAELIDLYPADSDEKKRYEQWNKMFYCSYADAVAEVSNFTKTSVLHFALFDSIRSGSRTPSELIYYACSVWTEFLNSFAAHPSEGLYEQVWNLYDQFGNPLNLVNETISTSLPRLQVLADKLKLECQGVENDRLHALVEALRTTISYYSSLEQNLEPYDPDSPLRCEAYAEKETFAPYMQQIQDLISSAIMDHIEKLSTDSHVSISSLTDRILYLNRAIIPTLWNADGTSGLPFTPDGDLDLKYITSTGIKLHCLEHLLKSGLLDPTRISPVPCSADRVNKKHPCHTCNLCPQIFPLEARLF